MSTLTAYEAKVVSTSGLEIQGCLHWGPRKPELSILAASEARVIYTGSLGSQGCLTGSLENPLARAEQHWNQAGNKVEETVRPGRSALGSAQSGEC